MKTIKKVAKGVIIGLSMGLLFALSTSFLFQALIDRLENVTYYFRYRFKFSEIDEEQIQAINEESYGVYMVDIDERSMDRLGVYWGWDRSYQAELIDALSEKFPAAIIYDIFFSSPEDSTHIGRLERLFRRASENKDTDPENIEEIKRDLFSAINYDSSMIEAIKKSGRVILGMLPTNEQDYRHLSQVAHRMTPEFHESLNPASTLQFPKELRGQILDERKILDGIFPQLAQSAADIGHILAIPNEDGIIREIPLLFGFSDLDPVYPAVSLRAALTLFATPNEEVEFVPEQYIDIGKPFKVFRDSLGKISFSYPNITVAQIRELLRKSDELRSLQRGQRVDVSTFLSVKKDFSDSLSFEFRSTGPLPPDVSSALFHADFEQLLTLGIGEEAMLKNDVRIVRDCETEWEIESGEDMWWINSSDFLSLSGVEPEDLEGLERGERKLIFHDFRVHRTQNGLVSTIPVLREKTIEDLIERGWEEIEQLEPGGRLDFGENVRIPLTRHNRHIITYFGPQKVPFNYYSFYDIMQRRVHGSLEGKIFIIGSSATSLFDIKAVPHDENYPAMEIHASLLNSFLTNRFVRRLAPWQNFLILLGTGTLIGFVAILLKPLWGAVFSIFALFSYFVFTLIIFQTDLIWFEVARPLLAIILTYTAVMAYRYVTEEKDRKFLQSTFKQYLSPELIDMMYIRRQSPKLGGDEGVRTAFFTDIEGFSTFSEKLGSPTRLVELLNEYLTEMTDILLSHFGTLDKYEGDAIIAFFGAPVPMEDHAVQACNAALAMQNSLSSLREKWRKQGDKWPRVVHNMRMRIGINTGVITTGNMGSAVRMNYTMMGDAVNLAARLESAAKQYGVYTIVSQQTRDITGDLFEMRKLDNVTVVGKSEPVVIYELIAQKGAPDRSYAEMVEIYSEAQELFYKREWARAAELFERSHTVEPNREYTKNNITPSLRFLELCKKYMVNPPDPNWNGVNNLTSK